MSLRYALLALLTSQPLTGYDVYKHFERSVGYVWHAPDSQIYPELRRMEKDGLLGGVEEAWGQKGKKKRYHITPRRGGGVSGLDEHHARLCAGARPDPPQGRLPRMG
ncbi:PadR family transcriptional regulator [Arthrobacter sp. H16F315]|uniref:PadR family transcriptional regulator n=1 Tax=Arthrobacter sp. H16F315 TaxID=2955314 RepID=UPI003157F856